VLQCVVVYCNVLQCVAVCGSVLQCVTVCGSVLQCVAVCHLVLKCVAACFSILYCVDVYYSVLKRMAVFCLHCSFSSPTSPHSPPVLILTYSSCSPYFATPNSRNTLMTSVFFPSSSHCFWAKLWVMFTQ